MKSPAFVVTIVFCSGLISNRAAFTNRISLDSNAGFKSNVNCSGLRQPGTIQIKEGINTNWSCLAMTVTSTLSFNKRFISNAAVRPAKLPPTTITFGFIFIFSPTHTRFIV